MILFLALALTMFLCFLFVSWDRRNTAIYLIGMLSILVMVFASAVCLGIFSAVPQRYGIETMLYNWVQSLDLRISDIIFAVNTGIFLFMLSSVLFCIENNGVFKENKAPVYYGILLAVSAVCIFCLNSPYANEEAYFSYVENGGKTIAVQIRSFVNNTIVFLFCVLPVVNTVLNVRKTKLIFRKKYYVAMLMPELIIALGTICLLYNTHIGFFFNNFRLYDFGYLNQNKNYDICFWYADMVMLLISATVILMAKLNVVCGKVRFLKYRPSIDVNEIRHVFHTYKNAMFSIKAMSDMAVAKEGADDIKAMVNKIRRCAENYGQHIGRFLSIDNGSRGINEVYSFTDCVVKAEAMQVVPPNITIVKDIRTSDDLVIGNFDDMTEVFSNLISNSIEAINKKKRKEGKITIVVWNEEKNVCAVVRDNGAGISRKHIRKIFVPFYTTKQNSKNWGIGLSHVKSVVEKQNGRIDVISREGIYTEFQIFLPIAKG